MKGSTLSVRKDTMWLCAVFLFNLFAMPNFVAARFCEGGHICSLPRECCTQGCCPPYQSGPRQLPPPSEHVLNLFFISHWFFWCVVVAIILAVLCAYSLWKKRRTLCGWGFPEHHTQSEGDSAGSCYAPPQYSRCNSFHHPPPPYTEVTSKPDLYPLVFTCNSDNVKNGSSYLMVQYFRNYIVRPSGTLSAASTVDSLSSSFICNANEANTLVPPPYSRAASPELGFSSPFHYMMPRSASQLVCASAATAQQEYSLPGGQLSYTARNAHYTTVTITGVPGGGGGGGGSGAASNALSTPLHTLPYSNTLRALNAPQPRSPNDNSPESTRSGGSGASEHQTTQGVRREQQRFMQSQSDQHFHYMGQSNSSISDIFVNSGNNNVTSQQQQHMSHGAVRISSLGTQATHYSEDDSLSSSVAGGLPITTTTAATTHPQPGGTPVIFSNGCIKPNPLHRTNTNPTHFPDVHQRAVDRAVYNSCNSIGGISITVPVTSSSGSCPNGGSGGGSGTASVDGHNAAEYRDLHMLRHSLETCCQLLQQQQQHQQHHQQPSLMDSPLRLQELLKKYAGEEGVRSYMTSGTVSGVSSLTNIGTPSSPPQATSPTCEVRDILDQIRQLQAGISQEELALAMLPVANTRPQLHHTMSSPTVVGAKQRPDTSLVVQRYATMPEQAETIILPQSSESTAASPTPSSTSNTTQRSLSCGSNASTTASKMLTSITAKRPVSLHKKFYTPKPNKAMYMPMLATSDVGTTGTTTGASTPSGVSRTLLKSPVGSVVSGNFFGSRNRARIGWISRSAPTTPGTALPPNHMGDDSPLLNEHDEDAEAEQND